MNLKQQQELLRKYLQGTASPEEREWVEKWYDAFENTEPDFARQSITSSEGEEMQSAILKRIRRRKVVQLWQTVGSVAAAFAIILLGGWYLYQQNSNNPDKTYSYITSEVGENLQVILPDSSTLWLNGQTSIKYIQNSFGKNSREIWLESGEAFFDVKHDDSQPFIVHTGSISTKVLGTSFNIKSSAKYQDIQVTVTRGKVQVNSGITTLGLLTRGKQINYNVNTAQYALSEVNPDYAIAWQRTDINLERASFEELSEIFYSLYNTRLRAEKESIKQNKYTLSIGKNISEDMVLEIVAAIHQLKYKKINGDIILY